MHFDVIVIGGGHAGCEAASAAARAGAKTCLATYSSNNIGEMSCNPSIGGVGKGIIVKEIDAMDGVMSKAIDAAGIHYKILNKSRGPAVWGPRAQADRQLYKNAMWQLLSVQENLSMIFGEVVDIMIDSDEKPRVSGIKIVAKDGRLMTIHGRVVVLTSGTFLGGIIHVGNEKTPAGRYGEQASNILAQKLRGLGLNVARLKTGTPPRLKRSTIDFATLEEQPGDAFPIYFSYDTKDYIAEQISCYITYTNHKTHDIIAENIELSPMYSGQITATGPRYCPSIEDKIKRFADKQRHQVFLEPEGIDCDVIYPNGISTSLPKDVQARLVYSIPGLHNVEILKYGYAIEYDYFDPKQLHYTLESKIINGLYMAGQINGTTGYEEAAGQGLIAGVNAAFHGTDKRFVLTRGEAYIGVMIDDLVTKGITEPYRMMTSRAEFRLTLRYDNADARLLDRSDKFGIISTDRKMVFDDEQKNLDKMLFHARNIKIDRDMITSEIQNIDMNKISSLADILGMSFADLDPTKLSQNYNLSRVDITTLQRIHAERLYQHYLKKQQRDIDTLNSDKNMNIPNDINYATISSLSHEIRSKLSLLKPSTILELKRIEGITPSAVIAIQLHLRNSANR